MDITLDGLLVGLFALAIGLAFAFYGFKIFLVLLPIWGFFAGFVLGANAISALFPDSGFLIEVTGWVLGFLLGLLFAVLSYLYYWVAVILLGGVLGYQLTYGVLYWIGFEADGIIAFILAIAGGAIFAVGFFVLQMPAVLVIVVTAISGAGAAMAGVAIGLGFIDVENLQGGIYGVFKYADLGWLGIIGAIALAFAGAIYQTRTIADMTARITSDSYMNSGLTDRGGTAA